MSNTTSSPVISGNNTNPQPLASTVSLSTSLPVANSPTTTRNSLTQSKSFDLPSTGRTALGSTTPSLVDPVPSSSTSSSVGTTSDETTTCINCPTCNTPIQTPPIGIKPNPNPYKVLNISSSSVVISFPNELLVK